MTVDLSRFQDADGNWLDTDRWPSTTAVATCRTTGCPAKDVPVTAVIAENVDGAYRVECGPCRQPVTDIQPASR